MSKRFGCEKKGRVQKEGFHDTQLDKNLIQKICTCYVEELVVKRKVRKQPPITKGGLPNTLLDRNLTQKFATIV